MLSAHLTDMHNAKKYWPILYSNLLYKMGLGIKVLGWKLKILQINT